MAAVTADRGARIAGLAAGLGAVVVVGLGAWSVPPSAAPVGAAVTISAAHHAALDVSPAETLLSERALSPGRTVTATVRVGNGAGVPLVVRPRLAAEMGTPLDRLVRVELDHRGRSLHAGAAGALRGPGGRVRLGTRGTQAITVRVSLPAGAERAARHRSGRWTLSFDVGPAR